jgi:hypothetical protein
MEKEIKENILRLTGKCSLPQSLEIGNRYKIIIEGAITSITHEDAEDGTLLRYHKFVPVIVSVIKDTGEVIKAKDTRRMSQKLRGIIYKIWESEEKDSRPFETAYEDTMKFLLQDVEFLFKEAKNRYEKKES